MQRTGHVLQDRTPGLLEDREPVQSVHETGCSSSLLVQNGSAGAGLHRQVQSGSWASAPLLSITSLRRAARRRPRPPRALRRPTPRRRRCARRARRRVRCARRRVRCARRLATATATATRPASGRAPRRASRRASRRPRAPTSRTPRRARVPRPSRGGALRRPLGAAAARADVRVLVARDDGEHRAKRALGALSALPAHAQSAGSGRARRPRPN